ncbi:methylaspartate mutase epsilon subunit [Streptosporangium album]|uniref:Methylaspartate mutase epsilon subunit n=1 Tax=Streptosporangium album TaxID=47479 RepID=A0A7W7S542_9ACTN|nr:methylaspartate mutase [Streptosporangium album]MBB4944050.1 methylaspartate mutase epsilon subunit [Streptosporangium album]
MNEIVPSSGRAVSRRERGGFGDFVLRTHASGGLVVQPRMGFSDPDEMRTGLIATKEASATTVGTLTLDSYTRVGDREAARRALRAGLRLNGYPIVEHGAELTRLVLNGVRGPGFPVQVRHGSATPLNIFASLIEAGLDATEGGPVSYCLPYGRVPLAESVRNWARCSEIFARLRETGREPHLETFGGCMLGQLCPPSQLVAISVLEALFFYRYGLRSLSASYAQQTDPAQDREAIFALRRLCAELLPEADWHVVVYAYMGVYPTTPEGSYKLLARAAELAVATHSERLIVKTVAEAHRIPTVAENVAALEYAAAVAAMARPARGPSLTEDTQTYVEARTLVNAVLNLDPDIGRALLRAFQHGYLDIPYCVHPDNRGQTRSYIDGDGWLRWAEIGSLPLSHVVKGTQPRAMTSAGLLDALSYVQRKFDGAAPSAIRRNDLRGKSGHMMLARSPAVNPGSGVS